MPVFIVRRAETRGLIGIFAVSGIDDIDSHLSNCANASECECCEIDAGGVLWPAPGGRKIPAGQDEGMDADVAQVDEHEDQEDPDPMRLLAGAILTESWQEAFYEDAHDWHPVPVTPDS